jgi:hypothetical protein
MGELFLLSTSRRAFSSSKTEGVEALPWKNMMGLLSDGLFGSALIKLYTHLLHHRPGQSWSCETIGCCMDQRVQRLPLSLALF